MRLVTYNIQYSLGRDGHYDLARIVEAVKDADIIALQEVERYCQRSGDQDQPAEIAALLPEHYWIYGPPVDLDASYRDGEGRLINRRRQFGNMLLSRWPICSSRLYLLPKHGTTNKFNPQYGALEGVVNCPGGPLRIYSLHLGYLSDEERQEQVAVLWQWLRHAPDGGGVWSGFEEKKREHWGLGDGEPPMPREMILLGDFNAPPGSGAYEALVGPKEPYYGRLNARHRLVDSWVAAGHDEAHGVTCPAQPDARGHPDLRVDLGLVSWELAGRVKRAWIDEKADGSDHQPYWFELDWGS
ncbi:MAG: endonuclease/exonuclease/phosphatase family protein [Pseudomonadota bacterium]